MLRGTLLAVLVLAAPLAAAGPRTGLELTPFAGWRTGGEFEAQPDGGVARDTDLDEGGSAGLIINFPADAQTEWELYYGRQRTELGQAGEGAPGEPVPGRVTLSYLHAGGTYLFDDPFGGGQARPYVVATIGATRMDPAGFDPETWFSFALGGGLKLAPTRRLGLRLEGRFFGSVVDSDEAIFCRSDPEGSRCLLVASGDVLWQFEALAGVVFRF